MSADVYRCTRCAEQRWITIDDALARGLMDGPWRLPARVADEVLGCCPCGGRFRYTANVRCPACHSDDVDLYAGGIPSDAD